MQYTSEIEFIDTTLREGFQSSLNLFQKPATPTAYASAALDCLNVSYLEIYGPNIYYPTEEYESLVELLGQRLQLYCGGGGR